MAVGKRVKPKTPEVAEAFIITVDVSARIVSFRERTL
jgi:hypothetical protein